MLDDFRSALGADAVSVDPDDLRAHARDWWPLAMLRERRGDALQVPAAVVRPRSVEEVARALVVAQTLGIAVVPFGGGSGVCGAAQASAGSIALDLTLLDEIRIDDASLTVRAQAGVMGPVLEAALNDAGLTLGHFPQSIDLSTVGGWVATRSAGQKSARYGRIDDVLLGATVVLANGKVVEMPARAGTSAGPDLVRLFAGSEGTLGVIADATLRVRPIASRSEHATARFATFEEGLDALRLIARRDLEPAVCRLYDEPDAFIAFREHAPGGAVLVLRFEGDDPLYEPERDEVLRVVRDAGGMMLGTELSESWWEHRNAAVQTLQHILFDGALGPHGFADTMEVSGLWPAGALYAGVREALSRHADLVGCHASHLYPQGTCLYFTFVITTAADDDEVERRYRALWDDAMQAVLAAGGSITHHHGVGLLRAPWIDRELGEGLALWRTIKRALDPSGILNPGKAGL